MYIAGAKKSALGAEFWNDVYGFSMQSIAELIGKQSTDKAIVREVKAADVITSSQSIANFDIATMRKEDADFHSEFELQQQVSALTDNLSARLFFFPLDQSLAIWYKRVLYKNVCLSSHDHMTSFDSFCRQKSYERHHWWFCQGAIRVMVVNRVWKPFANHDSCMTHDHSFHATNAYWFQALLIGASELFWVDSTKSGMRPLLMAYINMNINIELYTCVSECNQSLKYELSQGNSETETCHALVVWFDVAFSSRFCKQKDVLLGTSPFEQQTHWAQTLLPLR